MTIGERVKARRKLLGFSADYLAEKLDISRATMFRYEKGEIEKMPIDLIVPLASILNTTPAYLMGWTEKAGAHNKIAEIHQAPQQAQTSTRIPVLGSIPAGIPIEAVEDVIDFEEIPSTWMTGNKEYFALKIQGNSMYPKYLEDDIVIFLKTPDCDNGADCAVIVNGDNATFKKVVKQTSGIVLQPLNSNDFEPVFYSNEDIEHLPVTVIGIAKEIRRKP